jgi:hypothetical protein
MAWIRIGALVLGLALAAWRLKRGWGTWGHLLQMLVSLAAVGATLGEEGIVSSVSSGLGLGILGTLWYWNARPATPVPDPEPMVDQVQTPEQERLQRHLQRMLSIGLPAVLLGELLLSLLYALEGLSFAWFVALELLLLIPLVVLAFIVRRLRATGPPYDRLPTLRSLLPKPARF